MNDLLSFRGIRSFEPLLAAYRKAGVQLANAVDGGAGAGHTSRQILKHVEGKVFAFEPFPGNHRFFEGLDARIALVPKALAEASKKMAFRVPSIVPADSAWGQKGMVGYSSVGYLAPQQREGDLTVECVRADDVIPKPYDIDFIKLDLQGGELNALKGMSAFLPETSLLWIEYTGQEGLLDHIVDIGFLAFDTEYFFMGTPTERATSEFSISRENVTLSTGRLAWFGFKKRPWGDFPTEFLAYKKELGLVQTDLACINSSRLDPFMMSARFL